MALTPEEQKQVDQNLEKLAQHASMMLHAGMPRELIAKQFETYGVEKELALLIVDQVSTELAKRSQNKSP